jgi:hypothetical protein
MRHDVPHAPDLRIRTGAVDTHRRSGYAPEQRIRAGAADTRQSSGYAPVQRIRAGAAVTRRMRLKWIQGRKAFMQLR